ncbi:sensor histidine kinase [Alcaligenes sp. SDU_A2]|uniref:sensor histidine kinase n=1 Tax=Alcaligenes sp. SDU_A2 TaxID=3136634 RepID=UPI00312038AA
MFPRTRSFKFSYAVAAKLKKLQDRWRVIVALVLSWAVLLSWVAWDEGLEQTAGVRSQQAVSETLAMHTKQILAEADRLVWRLVRQASIRGHDHSWLDSVLEEAKLSSLISGIAIYDQNKQLLMSAGQINVKLPPADLKGANHARYVAAPESSLTLISKSPPGELTQAGMVKYRINLAYFHQMVRLVVGDEPWLLLLMDANSYWVLGAYPSMPPRWQEQDVQRAMRRLAAQGGTANAFTYFTENKRHVLSVARMEPWPLLLVTESGTLHPWALVCWKRWGAVGVLLLLSAVLLRWDWRRQHGTGRRLLDSGRARGRRASRVFERMFETLPDAVIMFDAQAQVEGINLAMQRLLDCGDDKSRPHCLLDFIRLLLPGQERVSGGDSAGLESVLRGLNAVIRRAQREFRCMQVQAVSHPARVLELRAHAALEPDDATLVVVRDVTLQVELDRMRSEFLSLAAHELRAPLAAVSGYVELLELGLVAPDRQPMVYTQVREKVRDMTALLESLARLNRVEHAGDWRQDWRQVDLRALLRLSLRAFYETRHRIRLELPSSALHANVDAMQLLVAVRNALENALKYSAQDTEVVLRLWRLSAGWACVEVIDQGPGIEPGYHGRVFDKFFRVPGQQVQGTGLGLAILKSIITNHGGRVYFHPDTRHGTRLVMELALLSSAPYLS